MKPSREQILANRDALISALKTGTIKLSGKPYACGSAWIRFEGTGFTGEPTRFDLTHDVGHRYAGFGDEARDMDQLAYHVGDDDEFQTVRLGWGVSGRIPSGNEDALSVGRMKIIALFSPDGDRSHAETVEFIDSAFATVRNAALASPGASPSPNA